MEKLVEKTTASVVSATELSAKQLSVLKDVLSNKLYKEVEISAKVDSSLLGGLYIHVEGHIIDNSIKKQLSEMRKSIRQKDKV